MSDLNRLLLEFSSSNSSIVKPDRKPNDVLLYVFDLIDQLDFFRRHSLKAYAKMRGYPERSIVYTSVVVYDLEYTYGPYGVTITPVNELNGRPHAINMYWRGRTALTPHLVTETVQSLISDSCFLPQLYDLNRNNSNHFCDALLRELVGNGLPPEWTNMFIDKWILELLPDDLVSGRSRNFPGRTLQLLPPPARGAKTK